MKRFLIGVFIGLLLGWVFVPIIKATFSVGASGDTLKVADVVKPPIFHYPPDLKPSYEEADDEPNIHSYKGYLQQMLKEIREVNAHLEKIEINTAAVKEKLHA